MDALLHNFDKNPLNMDLILKLVLEHVGVASIADLKTCRLVNHSWNRLAVQVLHKHGHVAELDYQKMVDFHSLLFHTQLSQLQRPYSNKKLASLRLSLSLLPYNYFDGMSELGKAGQLLVLNSHLRLAFIKCQFIDRQQDLQVDNQNRLVKLRTNHELFNLFKLASSSLTSIKILNDNREIPPRFEEFEFGRYLPLEFPRLVAVQYKAFSPDTDTGDNILDITKHVASVLLRAPKLTKLKLTFQEGNPERKTNNFRALMENCSAQNLQELRLQYLQYTELAQVLYEMKFPNLKMLQIKDGLLIFTKDYNQFLAENCPALTTMGLKWGCLCASKNVTFECPLLPNILHLSLYPHFSTTPTSLESIHSIFSSVISNLTSLQSMSTNYGVLMMLGVHLKESGHLLPPPYLYPVFPDITTLEIEIDCTFELMVGLFEELEMSTLIYHHTFPNLRTLRIKLFKALEVASEITYAHILTLIDGRFYEAIRFLCNHHGIQHLEILGHTNGWMDELLKDNQNVQGLKSLKLVEYVPPTEDNDRISAKDLPAYLNLFTTTTME